MKAVIPAAGIGKRLRPFTLTRPKVLLPVAGKPIIGHILDRVIDSGIDDVTLIIGYMGEKVIEYVEQNYEVRLRFIEQKDRRGLGHAVGMGLEESDEEVLVILGDTILDLDFKEFTRAKHSVIGVMTVDDPHRFGIVEHREGWITRLVEKPKEPASNLAIAGIYLLKSQLRLKKAIEYIVEHNITTKGEYQLTDALQVLLDRGEQMRIENITACYDCGTRDTLLMTNRHLLKSVEQDFRRYDSSIIIPPVSIHPSVEIDRSIVGPDVSVGENSVIRNSIIEDSIVDNNTVIEDLIIKNCLFGYKSTVKGTCCTSDIGDYSSHKLC